MKSTADALADVLADALADVLADAWAHVFSKVKTGFLITLVTMGTEF